VDSLNNYYLTDSVNNRVVKYNPATGSLTNFAGLPGVSGTTDGIGQFARFFSPQGIAFVRNRVIDGKAKDGFVVSDSGNHLIRFVGIDGDVTTLAGHPGSPGPREDGKGAEVQFNNPSGLAVDAAGVVYIADSGFGAIRKLYPDNTVRTLATGFASPSAVAVGDRNEVYVANTFNHSIKMIEGNESNPTITTFAGSDSRFKNGLLDHVIATEALFDGPRGLLWVGGKTGLLVSDSFNRVLRRVFLHPDFQIYSVATLDNTANGVLRFPVGLAKDLDGNILVVDLEAKSLRRIPSTQTVQPPVRRPVIGIVGLVTNIFNELVTQLSPVTNATFNNEVVVAIVSEPQTQTYFTFGATDDLESIPDPNQQNGSSPPDYVDGSPVLPKSIIDSQRRQADLIIKAIGTAANRVPSPVVTARFRFQVSNPTIVGNNPASFTLESATERAELWYTTDGTIPTNGAANARLFVAGSRLNVVSGTNDVVFNVRGFRDGYVPSSVVQRTFFFTNILTSAVGVPRDLLGTVGSTVVVPIQVKLAPNDLLQSLQFRVEVTPKDAGAPPLSENLRVVPFSNRDFIPVTNPGVDQPHQVIPYANGSSRGLAVVFHGNRGFSVSDSATVVMVAVPLPASAAFGQNYTIAIARPSGTSDGIQTPITLTNLPHRTITLTNLNYLVGDTAVATWYNAGEFGNGDLNNNDVNNVFAASLGLRVPPLFSDAFDAMDAYPVDTTDLAGGDGHIRFLDWQRILRLSLGLETNNWRRSRSANGDLMAIPTTLGGFPSTPAVSQTQAPGSVWVRPAHLSASTTVNASRGGLVNVPVVVKLTPNSSLSGMQFRAIINPVGEAPPVAEAAKFIQSVGLPAPIPVEGLSPNQIGVAWDLGAFQPPLTRAVTIGHVQFRIPATALDGMRYLVSFANADGSPDSTTQYDFETLPGFVWVGTEAPLTV
ncbi:MAG: hypothetical protein AB1813_28040, partial [Verrucomicrobiota bacterium]